MSHGLEPLLKAGEVSPAESPNRWAQTRWVFARHKREVGES
jgi:hypothetical protein